MTLIDIIVGLFVCLTLFGVYMNVGHRWVISKIYPHRVILLERAFNGGWKYDSIKADIHFWLEDNRISHRIEWGGLNKIAFRREADAALFRMMFFDVTCVTFEQYVSQFENT